jgi:hypothetical protein
MGKYSGTVAKTVALANINWALEGAAGETGRIIEVTAGGESTASTAMRTRWNRATTPGVPVAGTPGDVQKLRANYPTNVLAFADGYATTEPVLAAGDLLTFSWNCHGGLIRWLAAPGEEWEINGLESIVCNPAVGTGVSTYGVIWEDD